MMWTNSTTSFFVINATYNDFDVDVGVSYKSHQNIILMQTKRYDVDEIGWNE